MATESMFSIAREAVPGDALLKTYRGGVHPERWGRYGDCFSVTVDRSATLADFVFAFYTSPLFRIERVMLRALILAPSSDAEARRLADGSAATFAAWYWHARPLEFTVQYSAGVPGLLVKLRMDGEACDTHCIIT
jgi:hypothetical protein